MKVTSAAKAFSLVELLIVIAIISILSIISAPVFSKYRGNVCLRESVRKIASDIQLCKASAAADGVRYRIIIDVKSNNYIVQKETSLGDWTNVSSIRNFGEQDEAVKIIGKPTHVAQIIYFQPRGTTNAGTLEIRHEKIMSTAKIVTSLTGRVRIKYDTK